MPAGHFPSPGIIGIAEVGSNQGELGKSPGNPIQGNVSVAELEFEGASAGSSQIAFAFSSSNPNETKDSNVVSHNQAAVDDILVSVTNTTISVLAAATPTPTAPAPTPTTGAGTANLNFKIKFQGINQSRLDKTVRVILQKGTTVVYTFNNINVIADQNGVYSGAITNVAPDTYDIFIKGPVHLQKGFSGITFNTGGNIQDWSATNLKAGDTNNDNRVDSGDFDRVASEYVPNTSANSPADFNLDGRVDSTDFDLFAGNYLKTGDSL